jgi:hypothetical protein
VTAKIKTRRPIRTIPHQCRKMIGRAAQYIGDLGAGAAPEAARHLARNLEAPNRSLHAIAAVAEQRKSDSKIKRSGDKQMSTDKPDDPRVSKDDWPSGDGSGVLVCWSFKTV